MAKEAEMGVVKEETVPSLRKKQVSRLGVTKLGMAWIRADLCLTATWDSLNDGNKDCQNCQC